MGMECIKTLIRFSERWYQISARSFFLQITFCNMLCFSRLLCGFGSISSTCTRISFHVIFCVLCPSYMCINGHLGEGESLGFQFSRNNDRNGNKYCTILWRSINLHIYWLIYSAVKHNSLHIFFQSRQCPHSERRRPGGYRQTILLLYRVVVRFHVESSPESGQMGVVRRRNCVLHVNCFLIIFGRVGEWIKIWRNGAYRRRRIECTVRIWEEN